MRSIAHVVLPAPHWSAEYRMSKSNHRHQMLCERAGGDLPFHRLMTSGAPLVALVIRHPGQLSPYLSTGRTDLSSAHLLIEGYDDTLEMVRIGVHRSALLRSNPEANQTTESHRLGGRRLAVVQFRTDKGFPSKPSAKRITQSAWCRRPTADANGWVKSRLVEWSGARRSAGRRGCSTRPTSLGSGRLWSHPLPA